ncbi:MAG: TonB-dependent receptor [Mangrovibacterium sp.]
MKKKLYRSGGGMPPLKKFILIMKLNVFLMLVAVLSVSASQVSAQETRLDLKMKDASLAKILDAMEDQSEVYFFYNKEQINENQKIDVDFRGLTVEEALNRLREALPITYEVVGKNIIIKPLDSVRQAVTQQPKSISGKVTDSLGQPLPGVTVVVKGTTQGIITDADGNYSLSNIPAGATLVFSFVGMKTEEIPVSGKTTINVAMDEETIGIEEVIAVGYGSVRKSDLTGSVASIHSDEINSSGTAVLEQALSGRIAGVVVNASDNAPGAGLDIRIRGTGSISASSAPLYVIDGFPIGGGYNTGGDLESSGQSPLVDLNPSDIESINILKDASATAIYGARGANGVVIITTKGGNAGRISVTFDVKTGLQFFTPVYDVMNSAQYAKHLHNRFFPYSARMAEPDPEAEQNYAWWDYEAYADTTNTDWTDVIMQVGKTQDYSVSVSGGDKKSNYLGSAGYYKNEGIIKYTDFERFTANFKVNGSPADWIKLSASTRFSFTRNNGTVTTNSYGSSNYAGILQQAVTTSPLQSVDESFIDIDGDITDEIIGNPLAVLRDVKMLRTSFRNMSNASVTLMPVKGLSINSMVGITVANSNFKYFAPASTPWGYSYNGRARITSSESLSFLNENTIDYNWKFGNDHRINALAGFTVQTGSSMTTEMVATNFPIENLGYNNMGVGVAFDAPFSSAAEDALLSYLGRLNYNAKDKYLATVSFRIDGSSKFAKNNKWGYFPSLALAWRLGEEPFVKNSGLFDNLKLRFGWGETGNPNISPYQSLTNYGLTKYPSGSELNTGVYPKNTGNTYLRWEKSVQTNIGLDIAVLDSRLSMTIDAYKKDTKDMLLNGDIPPSVGFGTYLYNSGCVQNKGIELAINAVIIEKRNFKWYADFNIAVNKNKVLDLGEFTTTDWINVPGTKNWETAILKEGDPVGLWYGYKTDGLWRQSDFTWNGSTYVLNPIGVDENGNPKYPAVLSAGVQPGERRFKDLSGPDGVPDGVVDTWDKTIIGISQPKHTGGFANRFEIRNFDLSIALEWSYGRDMYNANNRFFIENGTSNGIVADRWAPIQYELDANGMETGVVLDPGNPDGIYPGANGGASHMDMHDAYMEDGSYLRIKSVGVGYNLKGTALFKSLRLYVNALNLHTFTNYSGYDPNVDARNYGGLRPGYDLSSYPLAKTVMFGISAKF